MVRGDAAKPVLEAIAALLDHNTTKSGRVDGMDVIELDDPRYLARHEVHFSIKPFPFVEVEWTEDWAYTLLEGTPSDPVRALISYEKIKGTSHIEHLCGSILVQKRGPRESDIFIYEEAKATGRSAEDTVKGLKGTLASIEKANAPIPLALRAVPATGPSPSVPEPAAVKRAKRGAGARPGVTR